LDEARSAAAEFLKLYPDFSTEAYIADEKHEPLRWILRDGLRKAGMPW